MEVQAWHLKWKDDCNAKDINAMPKVLTVTNRTAFPNLFVLFQIGATLPVTSIVCERSISTLRFIKNDLRSTMTNDRLGQAKLIIRFPFPPACFLLMPQNFHYMEICTAWIFKYLQIFHYCNNEFFGTACFLKILVIMNNEK